VLAPAGIELKSIHIAYGVTAWDASTSDAQSCSCSIA